MTEAITGSSRPLAPARAAAVTRPVSAEASPVPETDRLKVGDEARKRGLIEADVQLYADAGMNIQATGTVRIQRTFIERLLRYVLDGSDRFKNVQTTYDPASGCYDAKAQVHFLGMDFPISARIRPSVDTKQVGLHLESLGIPMMGMVVRAPFVMRQVTELVARQLQAEHLQAKAAPRDAAVNLELNGLLQRIGMPYMAHIDREHTRIEGALDPRGDMVIRLDSDRKGPALSDTPDSDLSITASPGALDTALRHALGPDYEVTGVDVSQGQATVHGRAEVKEASAVVNTIQLLGILAALQGGASPGALNAEAAHVRIGLDLAARIDGRDLVITPSINKALGAMRESLEAAGLKPRLDGKSLRVDVDQLVAANGGQFQDMSFDPEGLKARLRFDLEALFNDPILRGTR